MSALVGVRQLRDRIIRVCDSEIASPSAEKIQELAAFLASKNALDADSARLIVECAACQCTKVAIYAALVATLSNRQPTFARLVVEHVLDSLRGAGEANVVRFAAELGHVRVVDAGLLRALFAGLDDEVDDRLALVTRPWRRGAHGDDDGGDDAAIVRVPGVAFTAAAPVTSATAPVMGAVVAASVRTLPAAFRCFAAADSEAGLRHRDERLVIECLVLDTCRHFAPTLSLCADRLLLGMPVRGRYDWIMVETLLGAMLGGDGDTLFYHALLCQLLRQQVRLAGLYFRAVDSLFRGVGTLDPDARQRFVDWFALHLSNFGFKWEWSQWVPLMAGLPDDDARVLFVRAVLGRCVRLSYWGRVEKSLPSELAVYMPPYPKPAPAAQVLDDASGGGSSSEAERLLLTVLSEATTYTHLRAGLRRHGAQLRALAASDEAKVRLLRVLGRYWASSEGHRLMVADLLVGAMVVDQMAVVSWVFSEHSAGSLISYAPWEVLHMAIGKTVERTKALRAAGASAAAKLEAQLREEKDLFLTTFQRFAMVLEAHLASAQQHDAGGDAWFRAVLAQMEAFGKRYAATIAPFVKTLETFVFSDDCDARVRDAFRKSMAGK